MWFNMKMTDTMISSFLILIYKIIYYLFIYLSLELCKCTLVISLNMNFGVLSDISIEFVDRYPPLAMVNNGNIGEITVYTLRKCRKLVKC